MEYQMNQIDEIIENKLTIDKDEIMKLKLTKYRANVEAKDLKKKIDNL
jgi:hypothetical protein